MSTEVSNPVWGFSTAGRIFFGWGAVSVLRDVAREFGRRVFVCTDQNMVKAGICETVVAQLSRRDGGSRKSLTAGSLRSIARRSSGPPRWPKPIRQMW